MRSLGKDLSTPKRGQRKTTKAEYGVKGEWLGDPLKWEFEPGVLVQAFCLDDGERLHVIFVRADAAERDAVFQAMGSTWSWSKHVMQKLVVEAVFRRPKAALWCHGLVTPKVINRSIQGFQEQQAERPEKVRAPWLLRFETPGTKAPEVIKL